MEINLKNRQAMIYDVDRLKAFLRKTTINPQAINRDSVYVSDSLEKTEEKYNQFLKKLEQEGIQIQQPTQDDNSLKNNISITLFGKSSQTTQQNEPKQEISVEEQKIPTPKIR